MTKEDIKALLLNRFCENFAFELSQIIIENKSIEILYDLAANRHLEMSRTEETKVLFRAAYVLETIYFIDRNLFSPFTERFFSDFTKCINASAKRHFCKIMIHLLSYQKPSYEKCDSIAQKCAEWSVEPKIKVAVRILAIKVLILLRKDIEWIDELLSDIIDMAGRSESPAIQCNMRKWRNAGELDSL